MLLPEAEAANEVIPLNELLDHHGEQPGAVVVVDEFLEGVADVDVVPAAAVRVLEHAGQADVLDDAMPIERELQVPQALVVDDPGNVVLVGQGDGLGRGDPDLAGQRGAEELVVGRPHERVVDDLHALEDGVLEIGPVVGHFVGDTVDEHGIGARLVHPRATDLDELGDDALLATGDLLDEFGREGPLAADDQSDLEGRCHEVLVSAKDKGRADGPRPSRAHPCTAGSCASSAANRG
mgnify:CR=1 FL=1